MKQYIVTWLRNFDPLDVIKKKCQKHIKTRLPEKKNIYKNDWYENRPTGSNVYKYENTNITRVQMIEIHTSFFGRFVMFATSSRYY